MTINHELEAIGKTYEIISRLTHPQQKRVLNWLESKIEETKPSENPSAEEGIEGVDFAIHAGYDAIGEQGIEQYKNLRNLLDDINIKSSSDKTLLTAAFMKSSRNMDQFKARDISNTLKEIGESVPNITLAVQQLIKKDLIQYIKGAKKGKRLKKKLEFTDFGEEIVKRAIENKELMLRRLR